MAAFTKGVSSLDDECRAQVKGLVASYKADKTKVAVVKDNLENVFKQKGLAKLRLLNWNQVITHPSNRDKLMLTASGCELRSGRLENVGFSLQTMEKGAWACEFHPVNRAQVNHVLNHFKTDERFAEYDASEVVAGSVGASHTNHIIAQVMQERKCNMPNGPVVVDGRYCKSAWMHNGDFEVAATRGIQWWVIRWEVMEEFGDDIADIFQAALNTDQHVGEGEVENRYVDIR